MPTSALSIRKWLIRPEPIEDKVVILTGASAGIGRAAAHAFAAEGADLVLVARRRDALLEVQDEIGRFGTSSLVVPADLGNDDAPSRVIAETMREFGRIDVLVNNAGLGNGGALCDMSASDVHAILQVNLHGTFRLSQVVLPIMLEQKRGHIVNVSSIAAKLCVPGISVYTATKAAIVAFSRCLRRELSGSGVRVSTLVGGITRTAMTARAMDEFFGAGKGMRWRVLKMLAWMIYEPDVPARAIVDIVRYRRREVLMGGLPAAAIAALEIVAPSLLDAAFAWSDTSAILSLVEKLGAT